MPVIVNVEVSAGVFAAVAIVSVELAPAPTAVGLNVPVAPAGNPLTLKFTFTLKPFTAPTLTVDVVLPPGATVALRGVANSVKLGVRATFSVTVAVCVSEPLVPVIVSVGLPSAARVVVATVKVELPPPAIAAGLNVPVAHVGTPVALKLTVPLNTSTPPTLTV